MTDPQVDRIVFAVCHAHDSPDLWRHTREDPEAFRRAVRIALMVGKAIESMPAIVNPPPARARRSIVLGQLCEELERGLEKWGGPTSDDRLDRLAWLRLIDEHRIRATRHGASDDEYRQGLVTIAALAVAAIEAHDRKAHNEEDPSP